MIKTRIQGILFCSLFMVACQTQVPQKEPIATSSSEPIKTSTTPVPSTGTITIPVKESEKPLIQETPQTAVTPSSLVAVQSPVPSNTPTPSPTPSTSNSSGGSSGGSSSSSSFPVTTGTVSVSLDPQSPVKQ